DGLRAFAWVHADADALGIDPGRIAVAGDSFGGNLSAVVALAAGRGEAPPCAAALLIYPWLDAELSSPSIATFATGFLLTRATMDWYRAHYLPEPAARTDPRASPLLAPDLAGMPPTIIMTAGFDPLRDEGRAFADRLSECGGDVTYRCADSMIHGFLNFSASLPAAGAFLGGAIDLLRARL
ncbi:MAG TPA: alpha/beta hydrolase, partial [Kofleriaceae bacterium]|nr:alpha/beta hydrolase [Kofleriaceae bacterium]